MKDISDNPMTVKQLIAFIAVAWTFTFVVWGLTVVNHNTVKNKLIIEVSELRERVTAIEKVVKIKVSVSAYTPPIAKCDTTPIVEYGKASWYGKPFHGRKTANGEIYDMYKESAAHKTLRLGTWVKVINLDNGKEFMVRLNDRGPFIPGRIIDLSYAAFQQIGDTDEGLINVKIIALEGL